MKYFALLTFIIFASYLLGFIKKPEKYQWMDRNYTTAIKGFSILTVVWAHSGARLFVGGIQFIAGIGVALFLMCSGYGLETSYEKNGLKGFWKKRLLGVCLPFWVVELVGLLATGAFSIKIYLLDFCFLKPATSYGWFMGYIVICYLIFYAVKRLIKDSRNDYSIIHLGEGCVISSEVQLLTHDYSIARGLQAIGKNNPDPYRDELFLKGISIGKNSFVGARTLLMPGTVIGDNCIIGAGSVVKGKIPDNSIVFGNPAKFYAKTTEWAEKKYKEHDYFVEE